MSESLSASLAVMLAAYALSTALVRPVRILAVRLGMIDRPGGRKAHGFPVPLLGGLAIYGSLVTVVAASLLFLPALKSSPLARLIPASLAALSNYVAIAPKLWALFAGSLIIVVVGFLDDLAGLAFPPAAKFAGQVAAALPLLPGGIYMDLLNRAPVLSMILSALWVVGITNSFNLLDNMDGLSSGIALICSGMFLALVLIRGEFFVALLLAAIIGSTIGFFQFNVSEGRHKIFLGDTGSLLLGYLLGSLSLIARYVDARDTTLFPVISPLIILGLPVFDTFSVMFIRWREGRPIFRGDQRHLSHRLVRMGMTSRQAVLICYLMAFAIAANALFMINSRNLHSVLAVLEVGALVAMVCILMSGRSRAAGTNEHPNAGDGED